ncbi:MAG: hypothetical protein ABJP02_18320 [Parasphingorhabdus sp.]|uniref:hypothetical protein n=1 Tax=Parasphingorhabdus sp. TaxID=2709688 RepID=UPI003298C96F
MTDAILRSRQSDLDSLSKRAFSNHIATLRKRYSVPEEVKIKKEAFESVGDLEDFMAHHHSAEMRSGKPTALTSRKTGITRATDAKAKKAIATALAKKKADRDARRPRRAAPSAPKARSGQPPKASKSASKPSISSLMTPGIYNDNPWRHVGLKSFPREIDPTVTKFRRQKRGVGKCTGNKLKSVMSAYSNAYYLAESARQEVLAIRQSLDAELLWHASYKYEEASLAHWFGADYSPRQINRMLTKIEAILTEWSLAFCGGFRGLLPVWIRCKSKNGVGGGPARHLVANTIELFPRYFEMSQYRRWITMLHEMGHRSTALLTPRDERHDLCEGGWNRANNMCYRNPGDVDEPKTNNLFLGDNPRELAIAATDGNLSARKTALNNIDNYVCYMWNRHRDHKVNMLYILPPGTKAPRLSPGERTAPSR